VSQFNLPYLDEDVTKNYELLKKPKLLLATDLHLQKYTSKVFTRRN